MFPYVLIHSVRIDNSTFKRVRKENRFKPDTNVLINPHTANVENMVSS